MSEDLTARQESLARNQAVYRSVNVQIEALNNAFEDAVGIGGEWVCECADTKCAVLVSARLDEYEAVRRNPRAFIVSPGHVFPEVEYVVAENERFAVVEKVGAAAQVAEATAPHAETASDAA
jgi:hypothetical protein